MFGPSVTHGFRVEPRSVLDIRRHATHVRKVFGITPNTTFFPMAEFIESWIDWGITYDIVDSTELPIGVEACCFPEKAIVQLTLHTYESACLDNPRARFTVIHELGHLALSHTRTFHRESNQGLEIKAFEDSEWQANTFAAEFLMPADDIRRRGLRTAGELILEYHVSDMAAQKRIKLLHKQGVLK